MRDDPVVVALVQRARDGDQAAWTALVQRYAPLVWSICAQHRLRRADAEDVGSNVWLRLVEALERLRDPAALPGWLATVTRRECLRVVRERGTQIPVDHDGFPDETSPEADAELLKQERHIALRQAFAGLPEHCRRLLTLLFGDPPVPYTEVAERLGMRVGGIGPTRGRCLAALRSSASLAPFAESPRGGS
ncbi:RNA polymerase sigma factor [Amycolatopsis sp. NPDC005003]